MAEYIRYKGERYKKVDSENEKSVRVDSLEQRIERVINKLYELFRSNPRINFNGNKIRYRIVDKNSIVFVCDNMTYDGDEKNTLYKMEDKTFPKVRSILRNEKIEAHTIKTMPKSDNKFRFKFVVSGRIRKPR